MGVPAGGVAVTGGVTSRVVGVGAGSGFRVAQPLPTDATSNATRATASRDRALTLRVRRWLPRGGRNSPRKGDLSMRSLPTPREGDILPGNCPDPA
jgi:hypothetical protein